MSGLVANGAIHVVGRPAQTFVGTQRTAVVGANGFALSGPGLDAEVQGLIGGRPDMCSSASARRG